jgi:putative spermidine/putrescine transport system ATP-binding protein
MQALSLHGLTRRFGRVAAVDDLSLEVASGEFVCLLGPSGCGKSTVLRLIAGFEAPDAGDILLDGRSIVALPPNRRPTSMVFQSHALWSHMSVFDNIAFGLRLRRLPRTRIAAEVAAVLEMVGLQGLARRRPAQLSGGQQQRVALARSLVLKPDILLLDEPFSSLDAHLRLRLRDELAAIHRRLGLTMIFVTHDQEEAMQLADRIVVMQHGRVEQADRPEALYDRPATLFVAGFIGAMNILAEADALAMDPSLQGGIPPGFVAVRPEDVELAPASRDGLTVTDSVKRGGARLVVLSGTHGQTLRVQLDHHTMAPRPGERVTTRFRRLLVYREAAPPVELHRAAAPVRMEQAAWLTGPTPR